jgi:hypothetical protein
MQSRQFKTVRRVVPLWANDTHSALNRTHIARLREPRTVEDVVNAVQRARADGEALAIAGGRHAMGGQQFLTDGSLLDMRRLNRVRELDEERGLLHVEAGITWPDVMRGYLSRPNGKTSYWGIRQKQTGADRLTIGGASAHRSPSAGNPERQGSVHTPHRPCDHRGRQLLPHLPSVCPSGSGDRLPSVHAELPRDETTSRSQRHLPE